MKIYTKTGDRGETGLLGGIRVSKTHPCIEVCGGLDELNSVIGVALASGLPRELSTILAVVQQDLFDLGGALAAVPGSSRNSSQVRSGRIVELETKIDIFESRLQPLVAFVMPGGGVGGSQLHWARTVCRRVERRYVSLMEAHTEHNFSRDLVYLNRLSDFLFVAARLANQEDGQAETTWLPNKSTD